MIMAKEKAVIRTDMSRFRWTLLEMKKHKVAYLMIAPFFILLAKTESVTSTRIPAC